MPHPKPLFPSSGWSPCSHHLADKTRLGQKKAAVIDDGIFYGANVDKILNKEQWDEKISEAKKDGKMELSASWDIQATPTFFFLEDGQKLDKLVGSENTELEKKLIKFVNGSVNHERSPKSDLH
ncbi:hypothetical protein C4D60_Mb07t05480 [Musa balbisiana]|uniref:Thioredoxin domain-containing protein n=1 Tax=Musa balbisiana TaxID=52838 RepID=A0A4S8JFP2_MUSBA|nr:hypothetical protein C4D60_Mb07t05480 [Musa balbisiana]